MFLLCNLSIAGELWVNQNLKTRTFLAVENANNGVTLKKYFQVKGEYQERIETTLYKNIDSAHQSINQIHFKKVRSLDLWAAQTSHRKITETDKGFFGGRNNHVIWETKNQWSDDWELKYAQWLQSNVHEDFFQKFRLPTDCADALVGFRWIFSRINYLPVANTLADTGELFGNFSMFRKWHKLETSANWYEDELFLTALNYIMDLTSSHTVVNDGYPVRIDRTGLLAGSYIITQNHGSGHAKIINETHFDEVTELPFYTLASTTPRAVRALVRETFVDQEWPTHLSKEILAFRWPVLKNSKWILQAPEAHSRYSVEQYDLKLRESYPAFISFVLSRVKESYDPVKLVAAGAKEISNYANLRIDVVNQGAIACKNNACPPNSDGYKNWSTVNRDEKLLKKFTELDILVNEFEAISPGLFDFWINQLRNTKIIVHGIEISLSNIRYLFEHKFTSVDPNLSPAERWGLDSTKALSAWLSKAETLLLKRNEVLAQLNTPCGADCFPKNEKWLEGNTYQIDADLNKLFVDVSSYCNVLGDVNCKTGLSYLGAKVLNLGSTNKTLAAWFDTIPFFHSDPRANFARRWGNLDGRKAYKLPYFETVRISKNALALLDERKLVNLNTGFTLFESPKDARIALSEDGSIFLISDSAGTIREGKVTSNTLAFYDLQDPSNILADFKNRRISYFEDNGFGIFKKVLSNTIIVFRIKNGSIELINKYSGKSMKLGPLLSMVQNKSTITFADIEKNKIFEFTLPLNDQFKDMNKMNILSYSYPQVFVDYKDQDWGLHYPIRVNLETSAWDVLDLGISGPYEVKWSNISLGKAFISNKINDDFPELFAVDFGSLTPKVTRLDNNFIGATALDGKVYFIQSKGSQWDQNLRNKFMEWGTEIKISSLNSTGNPTYINSLGLYFSNDVNGVFVILKDQTKVFLPKALTSPNDFSNVQVGSAEVLTYRFDTSYGDFWNMGGAVLLSNISKNQFSLNEELIPEFSLYSWLNKGDLLNERWQQAFMASTVKAGSLVSIGKNSGIWWGISE